MNMRLRQIITTESPRPSYRVEYKSDFNPEMARRVFENLDQHPVIRDWLTSYELGFGKSDPRPWKSGRRCKICGAEFSANPDYIICASCRGVYQGMTDLRDSIRTDLGLSVVA